MRDRGKAGGHGTVFWRLAAILVGTLLIVSVAAVAGTGWLSFPSGLELVENSIRLRLDGLAEEIELRASFDDDGVVQIPATLSSDLSFRFPDPVIVLDPNGDLISAHIPMGEEMAGSGEEPILTWSAELLADDAVDEDIIVNMGRRGGSDSWGYAPLFGPEGLHAGGIVVMPLQNSIDRELGGARSAFRKSMLIVAIVAALFAVIVGWILTRELVSPLREISQQVGAIGDGNLTARVDHKRSDEFGRLGAAVNAMAERVEESFERLTAADTLRRELVANVGHDLRTPLAALRGYIEEASRFIAEERGGEARAALATAERQADYLTDMVSDLFEISVLEGAKPPLNLESVPLAELITDAADRHEGGLRESGLALDRDVPGDLPLIRADGVRLLRVMDNLLENAKRYAPSGGRVTISAAVEGASTVRITVADNGPGMSEETVAHVFERYFRGGGARGRGEGVGLGLPICRAIARAHGGELTVRSVPGAGTSFTLTLPIAGNAVADGD